MSLLSSGQSDERIPASAGGVDLVLTAVSAVLVLAILTILLLWIG